MGNQIDENESLYSDQENVWAAQMAYCNITTEIINSTSKE